MQSTAVILNGPKDLGVDTLKITPPKAGDLVVDIAHSGISTGTEKLLWTGEMPPFPGMGYPLVPGYESVGAVVDAGAETGFKPGDWVFVPGANCYKGAFGLFGGASSRLVSAASRVTRIDSALKAQGALLALAATARHAMAGPNRTLPDLIVGHGVLGRLLARLTIAAGAPAPTVWEIDKSRCSGGEGYEVVHPFSDGRRDYRSIYDATGQSDVLNELVPVLEKGGEIVLAGFYAKPLAINFPPAFMKEARFRVAAEWTTDDLHATRALVENGDLSLDGLITHERPAADAANAYETAFNDTTCLKMILNWSGHA